MRTLKEILDTPIGGDLDLIDALTLIMITYPDVAASDKIIDALAELETLVNAEASQRPAPALTAREEMERETA